mmetsp:Transcript_3579/g.7018  ORF Transcript_3579/g.7018 Transcript_3579/m.7018 type:complete len:151 (-) Transcript_3579:123-575(-)
MCSHEMQSGYDIVRKSESKSPDIPDVDALDVFEAVRHIIDPEFPNTLEELNIIREEHITVDAPARVIRVQFTPTVPHCSMVSQIGLCIRMQLLREMPTNFKIDLMLTPGSHNTEEEVNKRLNDKERIAAALETPSIVEELQKLLKRRDGY